MVCNCQRICSWCGDESGNHLHRPTLLRTDAGFDCKVPDCNTFTDASSYGRRKE